MVGQMMDRERVENFFSDSIVIFGIVILLYLYQGFVF